MNTRELKQQCEILQAALRARNDGAAYEVLIDRVGLRAFLLRKPGALAFVQTENGPVTFYREGDVFAQIPFSVVFEYIRSGYTVEQACMLALDATVTAV